MENNNRNDEYEATLKAITEKLEGLHSLWMRLSSSPWEPNGGEQFGYILQKFKQLALALDNEKLLDISGKVEQNFAAVKASGNAFQYQSTISSLLHSARHQVTILQSQAVETTPEGSSQKPQSKESEKISPNEVLIISSLAEQITDRLKQQGFATKTVKTLEQAAFLLATGIPRAVLVDMHYQDKLQSGTQLMELFASLRQSMYPVIFLSGEDTIEDRIAATKAAGTAFLPAPVNFPLLIDKLRGGIANKTGAMPSARVLLIDDSVTDAALLEQSFTNQNISLNLVNLIEEILFSITDFKPELIVLNLEMKEIDGILLYQALRQYPAASTLPMILLAQPDKVSRYFPAIQEANSNMLCHPVAADYLAWCVRQRLAQLSEVKNQLQTIDKQDKLTGLLNRHHFLLKMKEIINAKGMPLRKNAVVILAMIQNICDIRSGIDAAKSDEMILNATSGFKTALKPLGKRAILQARYRDNTLAAMLVGVDENTVKLLSLNLIKEMQQSVPAANARSKQIDIRICVGASSVQTAPPDDYLALIQQAQLAILRAAKKDEPRFHILSPDAMQEKEPEVPELLLEKVNYAIENGLIKLYFQPIVGFQKDQHKRYEVLMRIYDVKGEVIPSGKIFDALSEHELNYRLDCWVIEQVMRLCSENPETVSSTSFFINLSARTVQEDDFSEWCKDKLQRYGLEYFPLVFEISEQALLDHPESTYDFIEQYRKLECHFSLQHFSGNARTVELLKEIPFNYVKLSASVFEQLNTDHKAQTEMKKMLIDLKARKITIVISEIEDLHLLPLIWSSGIQYAQGYFLQQPESSMNYDFSHNVFDDM